MFSPTVRRFVSASTLSTRAFTRFPLPQKTISSTFYRSISSSKPTTIGATDSLKDDVGEPKNASTDPNFVFETPTEEELAGDLGHSMDGKHVIVGRHVRRTLASFSMTDKVCVVTGAARGLGNLMARTFAESGANAIVILDLDEASAKQAAQDLMVWFEEHGQCEPGEIKAIGMGCDVSDEIQVQACFAKTIEEFGRVDVLVTAAGIVENFAAQDYPGHKFKKLMAVNVEGSFYCAREAAKDMMKRSAPGSIVMIGSMSGSVVNIPQPQAPYNASKAAVRHMASSLAVEWATKKIRVNVISPGYMNTALTRVILERDPALKQTWEDFTPVGRIGEPEDLKGAVIYLASDASAFTTGIDLKVDGGYTLT